MWDIVGYILIALSPFIAVAITAWIIALIDRAPR